MKTLGRILRSPLFWILIAVIILCLLIWFVGPLIGFGGTYPLRSVGWQLAAMVGLGGGFGMYLVFYFLLARARNVRLTKGITSGAEGEDTGPSAEQASADEVGTLKGGLNEALATLRKAKLGSGKGGGKQLYQLPWYMIIGPPGAGKTTALANSGLTFPLEEKYGKDSVKGVGGTRYCDWWFTNEAVLIDTAGRYTTQDSHREVDSAAWQGFLKLLKRTRPRQPINGVLIAVSVPDLALLSEADRVARARDIRMRIRELYEAFEVRFPIYVFFTKIDLASGFVEFFDDLNRDERAQVWGMTFPLDDGKDEAGVVARFGEEFDQLIDQLNDRMIDRLQQEQDVQRRGQIYTFPAQVASFREPAQDFLNEVFAPSRFEARPLLRGVYFTSGTQEGTPIDRVMGAMSSGFGIGRVARSTFSGSARSYFINRVLRGVVFPEASLAGRNRKREAFRKWVHRVAYACAVLLIVGMTTAWWFSYSGNSGMIAQAETDLVTYTDQIQPLELREVSGNDLRPILEPLATLRDMPPPFEDPDDPPIDYTFWLYQGETVDQLSNRAYRQGLNRLMLPRMLVRLEEQLRQNVFDPESADYVYEALKVYLMLGAQGPMNTALVEAWMELDWRQRYPGESEEMVQLRATLQDHLEAMLQAPILAIPLDGDLVAQARRLLIQYPPARRGYAQIQRSRAARDLDEWLISLEAGPASDRVFVRGSGRPLSEGIPGLYTYQGFHEVFLPSLDDVARRVASESWVIGRSDESGEMDEEQLKRDVTTLYLNDYASHWNDLLSDVIITPFMSLQHAIDVLFTLSGDASPLRAFLTSVAEETKLTAPPPGSGTGEADETDAVDTVTGQLEEIIGQAPTEGPTTGPAPGQSLEDRFEPLHRFVGAPGDPQSQLEQTIALLDELYQQMTDLSRVAGPDASIESLQGVNTGAVQQLSGAAARMPEPVAGWVGAVAGSAGSQAATVTVEGARANLSAEWQSTVLPLCRQALQGRYPVYRGSATDLTMDDFSRLFSPGGLVDSFFNTYLRRYADTSGANWRWRTVDNVDLGLSQDVLDQFQRAAAIRDAFFPQGSGPPSVGFEIKAIDLVGATQVTVDVHGQVLTYAHEFPRPMGMTWPVQTGPSQARVQFPVQAAGQSSAITADGPWGWMRLLDAGQISGAGLSDRFNVTWTVGGSSATFEIRANSVINPFTVRELGQFRCPEAL